MAAVEARLRLDKAPIVGRLDRGAVEAMHHLNVVRIQRVEPREVVARGLDEALCDALLDEPPDLVEAPVEEVLR